jgi:hypothetical protein
MSKSLAEAAKKILMEGGVPSVSPMDHGSPERDVKSTTVAKSSLKPGKTEGRFSNPGATPEGELDDVEDLGGATPTSTAKENLGAKASGKTKKDTSKPTSGALAAEPAKKAVAMAEEADLDEDIEISEELEDFISQMMEEGYSEDEIAEAIEENFEIVSEEKHDDEDEEEDDDEEDEKEEEDKEDMKKHMKEHVDALLAGEGLSEDFRAKAETIFESAVNTRINEEVKVLEEAYAASLEEEVEKIRAELTEQVDDYLNYVVEQWVTENEVAIETGLRTELTEDFISGLKNLFAEHYIDIPDEKVSVVEGLAEKVEALESKLNEQIEKNIDLSKQLNESKQFEIFVNACDGLTSTQAAKLQALVENINFTTADEYETKIHTLKEAYFSDNPVNTKDVLDNDGDTSSGMITEETTGRMSAYVKVLGKTLPK